VYSRWLRWSLFAAFVGLVLGTCVLAELQEAKIYNQRRPTPAEGQNSVSSEPIVKPLNQLHAEKGNEDSDWNKHLSDVLLVTFNGLLALFTWRLYRATAGLFSETAGLRQAADQQRSDMLRSIEATEKAAEATEKAAATARDALITTDRAFVFLEALDPSPVYGRRGSPASGHSGWEVRKFVVRPRWRNNGNTPTKDMTVMVNWTTLVGELPDDFPYLYREGTKAAPMYLGPEASEWSDAIQLGTWEATRVIEGQQNIFIWGRCDYHDIFDKTPRHYTKWCYRLIFTRTDPLPESQFVAFGPYNGSDEDTHQDRERA
jgi:hypothetical protein